MFHVEPSLLSLMLQCSNRLSYATIRPLPARPADVISLDRYVRLLSQPGLRSAILASLLGRLPIGIAGLAILMLAQDMTGSFATGGAVAACYVAGLAAVAPLLGRLIDRYGPRPIRG